MHRIITLAIALILINPIGLYAQTSAVIVGSSINPAQTEGIDFANQLLPTTSTQLVNSSAVSTSAWSVTNNVLTLPKQLGDFSNPQNSTLLAPNSPKGGLTSLGLQAQLNCASYQATGDSTSDEYCAAVNFMAGNCVRPSSLQSNVIAAAPPSYSVNPSNNLNNCANTFGSGAGMFGFNETQNPSSTGLQGHSQVLLNSTNAASTQTFSDVAAQTLTQTTAPLTVCSTDGLNSPKIVPAPKYSTHTCWISTTASLENCSVSLAVTVAENWTPPLATSSCVSGTLQGNTCIVSSLSLADSIQNCPAGFSLISGQCEQNVLNPAALKLTCAQGSQLNENTNQCVQTNIQINPATTTLSTCPSGSIRSVDNCIQTVSVPAVAVGSSCSLGQTLVGDVCTSIQTNTSIALQQLSCASNSQLIIGECVQISTSPASATYTCPVGSALSGQTCTAQVSATKIQQLSCNGIGTLSSYKPPSMPYQCYRIQNNFNCSFTASLYGLINVNTDTSSGKSVCILGPVSQLVCPANTVLTAGVCMLTIQSIATIGGYSCLSGVLTSDTCIVTVTSAPQITYNCPSLAPIDPSDKVVTSLINQSGGYSCVTNTTISLPAVTTYNCSIGYTLLGNICQKFISSPAEVIYSCVTPDILQDQNCVSHTNIITQAVPVFVCPPLQSLNEGLCLQKILESPDITFVCPTGSTPSSSANSSQLSCLTQLQIPVHVIQYCANGTNPLTLGCLQYAVSTQWNDACLALEQKAAEMIVLRP